MNVTDTYARIHRAVTETAAASGLTPHDVRVLVALREGGSELRSNVLEASVGGEGTAVRRSLITLYARGLADGFGPGRGPRRRGYRTHVCITDRGAVVADRALWRARGAVEGAAERRSDGRRAA